MYGEDDQEMYQSQKKLALSTIDDLTQLKIDLLEADVPVPTFVNNAIRHLKKKYLIQDNTIGEMLR
ncbi:MAG: hypothetical protein H7A24_07620 [Leptospiraceae bacterium]|nr:hypothetical protein [Leptospiraceae bacterium]MCP5511733.1 hypothetical protein [Leptospiraceae bacterium]